MITLPDSTPAPTDPAKAAKIDAEVASILAGQHSPMPPMQKVSVPGQQSSPDRQNLALESARQPGGRLDIDAWTTPNAARVSEFLQQEPDQGRIDRAAYEWLQNGSAAQAKGQGGGIHTSFQEGLRVYRDYRKARGERPFQYLPHDRTRTEERAARLQVPFFQKLFSGTGSMAEAFPEDHREAFEERFSTSLNPESEKQRLAGVMLVSTMLRRPADEVAELWPAYRAQYAQNFLKLDPSVDDAGFYKAASAAFTKEVADGETVRKIALQAQRSAIQGIPLLDALAKGKAHAPDEWKSFEPAARAGYASILSEFSDREIKAGRALFEAVAEMDGATVESISKGDGERAAWVLALEEYGRADRASREKIMNLIALQADSEGQDITNFFKRMGAAFASGTDFMSLGIGTLGSRAATADFEAIAERETDPQRKEELKARLPYFQGRESFGIDLSTAGVKVRRYLDDKREGFWDSLGDYSVMATESLPIMISAGLPYGAGIPAVIAAYGERNVATIRRESPTAPESTVTATAYAAGALEAGIDRLQVFTLGAKLPKLNSKLMQYGKPGAVAAAFARIGTVTVAEAGQEVIQDLTRPAVQEIAAALTDDIKGPHWGSIIAEEEEALGDIFGVSLIFGIIGGTGSTIMDYMHAPRISDALKDRDGLALAGYSAETVEQIVSMAEKNPAAAAEALKAAMMSTPKEERAANSQAARERMEAEASELSQEGPSVVPTLEKQEDGKIQVNFPDSPSVLVDSPEQALDAVREWEMAEDVDTTRAVREYLDHLTDYHASNPEAVFQGRQTGQSPTLESWAGDNKERIAQANARIDILLRQAGADMGMDRPLLSEVPILGTSRNVRANGITRMVADIHEGGNPLTVIEEAAEGVAKWLLNDGKIGEAKMLGWIRDTESKTQSKILSDNIANLSPDLLQQELAEAFSYIAKNNAVGKIAESSLPSAVKAFFRAFKETIAQALRIAADFTRLRSEGKIDSEFGYWLDVAAGLDPDFQLENLTAQMEAEQLAEAMQGFTEIQDGLRGRIPHPETLEAAGDPLAAEVRRLWDSIANNENSGASKAARTRKANDWFMPKGQPGNLDAVRRSLNELGFEFATPSEMLDSADLSISYGRKVFGGSETSTSVESFSIGRTTVSPTDSTQVFPGSDGSPTVIGPATFSIDVFHGSPHRVDRFSTDRIGTGEGQQVYGWGLYFADTKAVAETYSKGLTERDFINRVKEAYGEYDSPEVANEALAGVGLSEGQQQLIDALYEEDWLGFDYPHQAVQALLREPDAFDYGPAVTEALERFGNLYEVNLDIRPEDLLDWDQPLSSQSDSVQEALRAEFGSEIEWDLTAGEWYRELANPWAGPNGLSPDTLSLRLRDMGIPGLKYLDGNSRTAGQGTSNYVIFDESKISIQSHNGVPIEMASTPVVSRDTSTFSIALKTDPLLQAIEQNIKSPDRKAAVYISMKSQVTAVRRRFDQLRMQGAFDTDSGKIDRGRFEQIRDLAILEAIGKSMPPEIRGKIIGSFRKVADLRTTKGRQSYMVQLLPKIEAALESSLVRHYRTEIRKQFSQAEVKVSESKTRGGKIGALGHAVFDKAKEAMKLMDDPITEAGGKTAAEKAEAMASALRDQLEGSPDLTHEQMEQLDAEIQAIELFGDFGNADSARLQEGYDFLRGKYREGSSEWLSTLAARRDWRMSKIQVVEKAMGRKGPVTDAERNAATRRSESKLKKLDEGIMEAGLSGSQKIRRLGELTRDKDITALTEEMELDFLEAENQESDGNQSDNEALASMMRQVFGTSSEYGTAKKLRELTTAKGAAPVEKIEGRKTEVVSVPLRHVEAILAGDYHALEAGGERIAEHLTQLDDQDLAQLELAWEQFNTLPIDEQANKRTLTFSRTVAAGKRVTVGEINQLEGLQLYLTLNQPDQAAKGKRLGYDEETVSQLEKWLRPEVKALGTWMVNHIGADQFTIDSLHREEKGVGLKLVPNYFPVRNDVAAADNSGLSIDGSIRHSGRSIGFIKERVSNSAPPAYVNALAVFLAHRAQANFWKSHVSVLRKWGGVIRDERFASAVKVRMGETYYNSLDTMLRRIESGGSLNAAKLMAWDKVLKKLTSSFAVGTLGGRVSTLAVNLSAALNIGLEIPASEIAKGFEELMQRPEAFKEAFESAAVQRRLKQGASPEAQLANTKGPSAAPVLAQLHAWSQKGVMPINWADTGSNTLGAAIVWEHTRREAIRTGMTEAEAKAQAERKVALLLLHAAQPTSRLAKSEYELKAAENPLAALFTLFTSEPRKTMAILYMAAREVTTGKGTYGRAMAAQQLFVAAVVFQAADFMIRSAYAALAKADEDDPESAVDRLKEKIFDAKAWGYALTTTHLRAVPVAGEVWSQGWAKFLDQKSFPSSQNPLNRATREVLSFDKPETIGEAVDGAIDILQGVGPVLPGGSLFAQGGNVAEFVTGVATSNGVSLSMEDRSKRLVARLEVYRGELDKLHGPTMEPTGKIGHDGKPVKKANRKIQKAKWAALADRLRSDIAGATPELQSKVLQDAKVPLEVKEKVAKALNIKLSAPAQ